MSEGKVVMVRELLMQTTRVVTDKRNLAVQCLVLIAVLAFSGAATAQIYGWTDANGEVTYSNLPPPKGAKITDVIHDTPMSQQALNEAARRSEISALNDRIRLLELEAAASRRQVVDYSAPPSAPLSAGCGYDGYADCYGVSEPYYTTGLLYGTGGNRHYGNHHDHDKAHPPGHGTSPLRVAPLPPAQTTPIAASPNRSSISTH